jgi:hypothetical protein
VNLRFVITNLEVIPFAVCRVERVFYSRLRHGSVSLRRLYGFPARVDLEESSRSIRVVRFLTARTALAVRMARGMRISLVLAWAWAQVTIDASECMGGQCERASFLTHLTDTYRSLSAVFSAQRESCARTVLPVGRSVDGHCILAGPTTKPVRSTMQSLEPQARRISGTSPASHVALASYADFVASSPSHV